MKKLILILLTFILVLSMTAISYASPPTPVDIDPVNASLFITKDGVSVAGSTRTYVTMGTAPALQNEFLNTGVYNFIGGIAEPKVIGIYDASITAGEPTELLTINIEPEMYGIASTTVARLCYYESRAGKEDWEALNTRVEGTVVKADISVFTNPGPMVLIVDGSTVKEKPKPNVTIKNISGTNSLGSKVSAEMIYGAQDQLEAYFGGSLSKPMGFPSTVINNKYPDVTNDDLVLLRAMDLRLTGEQQYSPPFTFSFAFADINPDSKVYVLHGGEGWELVQSEAGNGTVTAHFNHLSPILIYAEASSLTQEQEDPEPVVTKEAEKPKDPAPVMGDGMIDLAVLIMIMATIGMALVLRKE